MKNLETYDLTIGIPVYNEVRHLENTLESILNEVKSSDKKIEIIIADNGSNDGTSELLERFLGSLSKNLRGIFTLINQGTNKGFNFNCDSIIKHSSGEYLWVLGAQELLLHGAIKEVFAQVQSGPRQIVVNAEVWDEASNSLANPWIYGNLPDATFENVNDFYWTIGGPCRSLSLNIVKTDLMKKSLEFPISSHYWGMFERHAYASVLESTNGHFKFVAKPVVRILIEESGWQLSGEDDFGTVAVKKAFPGFYADIEMAEIGLKMRKYGEKVGKSIGVWRDEFGLVRTFSTAKSFGLKVSPILLLRCAKVYKSSHWFWIIGLPILLLPRKILDPSKLEIARSFTHLIRRTFNLPAK